MFCGGRQFRVFSQKKGIQRYGPLNLVFLNLKEEAIRQEKTLFFFLYKLQYDRILKLEEALEEKSLLFATDKIGMMYLLAFSV